MPVPPVSSRFIPGRVSKILVPVFLLIVVLVLVFILVILFLALTDFTPGK